MRTRIAAARETDPIPDGSLESLVPLPEQDARDEPIVPTVDVPTVEAAGDESRSEDMATGSRQTRRRLSGRLRRLRRPSSLVAARPDPPAGRLLPVSARAVRTTGTVLLIAALLLGALYGLVLGINGFARWNARRLATRVVSTVSSENLLVIGVRDGAAIGFTALKIERANKRVLGIAIPDGAFMEVPGQGFDRIGVSYVSGPTVSEAAVSNYFAVEFKDYVVIDGDTYQALLQDQNIGAIVGKIRSTDLTASARTSLATFLGTVNVKDVWIVPLPVKAMSVGSERYFEPQRTQVADLLLQWWGVRIDQQKARTRVIVYNGVGTPGLASQAAQQLIRQGFQVVDSGNADHFGYVETTILVYHAPTEASAVRAALGVGVIKMQSAPQDLTDMIVIVGADYLPPVSDTSTETTEGAR